jgi:hypothetical protein
MQSERSKTCPATIADWASRPCDSSAVTARRTGRVNGRGKPNHVERVKKSEPVREQGISACAGALLLPLFGGGKAGMRGAYRKRRLSTKSVPHRESASVARPLTPTLSPEEGGEGAR